MTLGINIIVKNESAVLERVLGGIVRIADEIVVVDTGSTDNTVEIAKRYTDKVYSFEWIDDFSAARNFAVSKTESDYIMWLDADDIVPKKTAAGIAAFMRGADGSADTVMLPYIAGGSSASAKFFYYRERIVKRGKHAVWRGAVHEAIEPFGNVVKLPYAVVHAKPEGREAGTRNLDIYRRSVADGKTLSPRDKYYYARELFYNGLYAEAATVLEEFLAGDGFYVNKIDGCIVLAEAYSALGETDKALGAAAEGFAFGPPTGEGCCEMGGLYFNKGDYRTAAFWYGCALKAKPDVTGGAFVNLEMYGFVPLVWLAVCHDRLGEIDKAFKYHCRARKIRPDHPSIVANDKYFESLGYVRQ